MRRDSGLFILRQGCPVQGGGGIRKVSRKFRPRFLAALGRIELGHRRRQLDVFLGLGLQLLPGRWIGFQSLSNHRGQRLGPSGELPHDLADRRPRTAHPAHTRAKPGTAASAWHASGRTLTELRLLLLVAGSNDEREAKHGRQRSCTFQQSIHLDPLREQAKSRYPTPQTGQSRSSPPGTRL